MSEANNNGLVWFRKELVSNRFFVGGKAVEFEVLDGNRGVIGLDPNNVKHIPIIEALSAAAHEERGGIVKINFDQADNLKKNYPTNSTPRSKKDVLRAMPDLNRKRSNTPGNAAVPAEVNARLDDMQKRLQELASRPLAHQDPPKPENGTADDKPLAEGGKPATRRISMEELQKQALVEEKSPEK